MEGKMAETNVYELQVKVRRGLTRAPSNEEILDARIESVAHQPDQLQGLEEGSLP